MMDAKHILTLGALVVAFSGLLAQNNSTPFTDGSPFASVFDEGYRHRHDSLIFYYADSLESMGKRLGSGEAEAHAENLRTTYLMRHGSVEDFRASVRRWRETAKRHHLTRMYYDTFHREVTWLVNRKFFTQGLNVAIEMQDNAYSDTDPYGMFACYRILAHIQHTHNNYISARDAFIAAINYARRYVKDQNLTAEYYHTASCCYYLGDYSVGEAMCDSALASPGITEQYLINVTALRSVLAYLAGDTATFWSDRTKAKELSSHSKYKISGIAYGRIDLFALLAENRVDSAVNYVNSRPSGVERPSLFRRDLHLLLGDYRMACCDMDTVMMLHHSKAKDIYDEGLASLRASLTDAELRLGASELENERHELSLKNQAIESMNNDILLATTQLELDKLNERIARQSYDIENKELQASNQKLVEQRQLTLSEHQKDEIARHEAEEEYHRSFMTIILSIFFALIIFLICFWAYRRKQARRLDESNRALDEARQHAENMQRQAEHSEQMQALFMQNMSHEIRTPLNAICGFSQILADPESGPSIDQDVRKEFNDLINRNSELLTTLVNDILYVSELQTGNYRINVGEVSVNELCRDALRAVLHRRNPNVEMYFESEVTDGLTIVTDRLRVQQVLTNFLTNAIKHTDEGEIILHCSTDDPREMVVFSVTDTGEGVPADKAEVIFGRFEKLDTFRQGTGLGLAICRLIARILHGRAFLDTSHKAQGARFVFECPLAFVD